MFPVIVHDNISVWICVGEGIYFSIAAGLIRLQMPSVK